VDVHTLHRCRKRDCACGAQHTPFTANLPRTRLGVNINSKVHINPGNIGSFDAGHLDGSSHVLNSSSIEARAEEIQIPPPSCRYVSAYDGAGACLDALELPPVTRLGTLHLL
jgi:hypothetical protein